MVPGCIQAEVLPLAVAAVNMSLTDVSLEKIITDNSTEEEKNNNNKKNTLSTESRAPHDCRLVGKLKMRRKARNQGSSEAR